MVGGGGDGSVRSSDDAVVSYNLKLPAIYTYLLLFKPEK